MTKPVEIQRQKVAVGDNSLENLSGNGRFFLDGDNVQRSDIHAAVVIKPNEHSRHARIKSCMVGTSDTVLLTAAGDDGKWSKGLVLEQFLNISDHGQDFTLGRKLTQVLHGLH